MKKLKNTFIPWIIFIIVVLVGFQIFKTYSYWNIDTNSYVELLKWTWDVNSTALSIEKPIVIEMGDRVTTYADSLAVITWWDGSLTRVWEDSELEIRENSVSKDRSLINISFYLASGKTWSRIISFIWQDSSFTQSFDDIEAWVRGTVFDVDLSEEFLRVSDHEVQLSRQNGDTIILAEWEIFSTKTLTLIDLAEFLSNLEDAAWTEINKNFDTQYIEELTKKLQESLEIQNPFLFILEYFSPKYRLLYELDTADDFERVQKQLDKISEKKYPEIYDSVFARYQKMNFIGADQFEFYKRKVFYKKALVFLSDSDEGREQLLRSSAYDLQDILQTSDMTGLWETLDFLSDNKDLLQGLDLSFLRSWFDIIPAWLRESFSNSLDDVKDLIPELWDIDVDTIGNSAKDALNSIDTGVKGFLDSNVGWLLDKFKK